MTDADHRAEPDELDRLDEPLSVRARLGCTLVLLLLVVGLAIAADRLQVGT